MLSQRSVEGVVGLFLVAAILSLIVLAFKVSGLTSFFQPTGYSVSAEFDDIGQLKVRSPVKIGGVLVGEIADISLDRTTFKAIVKMNIHSNFKDIPNDSSLSILTAGLLGDNYIAITPMYSSSYLKNGDVLQDTHSAMILEKLIGQLVYKIGGGSKKEDSTVTTTSSNKTGSPTSVSSEGGSHEKN